MSWKDYIRAQWDRSVALVLLTIGVAVLVIGYNGVSQTGYPAEQIPYLLSAGIGAVFILGVAATIWLSADLRDEWRIVNQLNETLKRCENAVGADGNAAADAAMHVTSPGEPRVHDNGNAERSVTASESSQAVRRRRVPLSSTERT